MKINVGGEYVLDSDLLIPFYNYTEEGHKDDILVYLGKYFLYSLSEITGEVTYDDAYVFYSEEKKTFAYAIQRENFALEEEFQANIKYINFKENKIFINSHTIDNFNKNKGKLHTVWIDEDDYIYNKELTDKIYA